MEMNTRLAKLIEVAYNGRQVDFADEVGMSAPQVNAYINGKKGLGITAVTTILKAMPELNARWLILGEGNMFLNDKVDVLRERMLRRAEHLATAERYIAVMSPEELVQFNQCLFSHRIFKYTAEQLERWQQLAEERNARHVEAMAKALGKKQ